MEAGIRSVNTLLEQRGLDVIASKEYYRSIFRFPIIDYYRSLGFDFDSEPYEVLAPKWVSLYLENVKSADVFFDVRDVLEYIKASGVMQVVLSATELGMLEGQLSDLGIREYFCEVMGLDNIHAGSKLALANAWRQRNSSARVLLIGDTDHDVENAKALGADCVLVCRGHQSREYLCTLGVPVAEDLSFITGCV